MNIFQNKLIGMQAKVQKDTKVQSLCKGRLHDSQNYTVSWSSTATKHGNGMDGYCLPSL